MQQSLDDSTEFIIQLPIYITSPTRMLFKILFKDETHLMKLKEGQKFQDFYNYVVTSFKKLPSNYHIVYLDEDGDSITLDNQHDFDSLLDLGLAKVNVRIVDLKGSAEAQQHFDLKRQSSQAARHSFSTNPAKSEQEPEKARSSLIFQKEQSLEFKNFTQKIRQDYQQFNQQNRSKKEKRELLMEDLLRQNQEHTSLLIEEKMVPKQECFKKSIIKPSENNMEKRLSEKEKKIEEKKQEADGSDPQHNFVHDDISCNTCGVIPIIGNRYKCTICPDFDLCESCEQDATHNHALIKIRYRDQIYEQENKNQSTVAIVGQSLMYGGRALINGVGYIYKTVFKRNEDQGMIEAEKKKEIKAEIQVVKVKEQEKKEVKPKKEENRKKLVTESDRELDSANYLHSILGVDFNRCYAFVKKYPKLNNQELIVQYFENVKEI